MVERICKEEGGILAKDEFQRSLDELKSARILRENGLYFKSIVAPYYAVYHAPKRALLLKGFVPQSHEGVERILSLYYVKTGELEVNIGRIIGRLMKLRDEADYYPESTFGLAESTDALKMANEFVQHIQKNVKFDT